jgi:hypothetical protein
MVDRGRDLKRKGLGEGTSRDQPKRACRESLRFTGLNPDTWG